MSIPGSASPLLLASTAAAAGGYQIERSLRFNSADSAYLSRTPAVAGNRRTWTWAGWVKRSALGAYQRFFATAEIGIIQEYCRFESNDTLRIFENAGNLTTTQVFRDTSAWFHLVISVDTTQATSSDRTKLYVNGTQVTSFSTATYPSQNFDTQFNRTIPHFLGSGHVEYFSGYLADIHFIDGQALTPSSFTEVSATTGRIESKLYAGSFGTNGFWLPFNNNSTAAALGTDYSGNSNTWTVNNLSVTAGAGNDSLVDTPTSYGTDTSGVGGEVRGNYATLNPLQNGAGTLANGNLDMAGPASAYGTRVSTIGVSTGKWYFEATPTNGAGDAVLGITPSLSPSANIGNISDSYGASYGYLGNGSKLSNNSSSAYGASISNNDVVGVAFDADAGTLTFYKNGSSQGTAYSSIPSKTYFLGVSLYATTNTCSVNFGQRPFVYQTPGTNRPAATFLALCDTNLGAPLVALPNTLMDVLTWSGDSVNNRKLTTSFGPDLFWAKQRNGAAFHSLNDSVRGPNAMLQSNTTSAEQVNSNGYVITFASDGVNVTNGSDINASGNTYVGWAWDAGTTTASNPLGSITSQVRANVSAGFSVITWTSPSSGDYTIGHGLGVAPSLVITKSRSAGGDQWYTFHRSVCTSTSNYLKLLSTDALSTFAGAWGATLPTSTVVGLNAGGGFIASSATAVAYCFAPVVGYSSFGSFIPNGTADSSFVYCGFRPRFFLIKNTSATSNWITWDTARDSYNYASKELYPNLSDAEVTNSSTYSLDILSNGFKIRNPGLGSGGTWIFAAWAEAPFQYARAR